MKCALINPHWTFEGSVYFGCREPHLPLEYGYTKALLEREGHEALIIDGQLEGITLDAIGERVDAFKPELTVITTAPSYLFWRCPPPELRAPRETARRLRRIGGVIAAVGPHGSVTPRTVLDKLGADVVVMGECEEVVPKLARAARERPAWKDIRSICYGDGGDLCIQGGPHVSDMNSLPAIEWPSELVAGHFHQHHRFDARYARPGAEMETSRGCPYSCSFCARSSFRDRYRKRPLATVLEELDGLIARGVEYVYFIDEIFMPDGELLEALAARKVKFGIQTRIDLWDPALLDMLGRAGCVSIEAGVESISDSGRRMLNKKCDLSTDELVGKLMHARARVPFVQATLLDTRADDSGAVEEWRRYLHRFGVWTNKPVPVFPYPGSGEYAARWGAPDDRAWERAHKYYLEHNAVFSDIQDGRPLPLELLELSV